MGHFGKLQSVKDTFSKNTNKTYISEKHEQWFLQVFEPSLSLLESIKDEACQTPAGLRWYKGQLKLYPISFFLSDNHFILKDINQTEEKLNLIHKKYAGLENRYLLCEKFLDELERIINSGINRYISD